MENRLTMENNVPCTVGIYFCKRLMAFMLDMVVVNVLWYGLTWLMVQSQALYGPVWVLTVYNIFGWLFSWLYQAGLETSPLQATPGKMLLGLKVTNLAGERANFIQTSLRYWGQFLSMASLGVGYLMVFATPYRQTLHDQIGGCVVRER